MKKFLLRIIYFTAPLLLLFVGGLFFPATPRAQTSLLFATHDKDELLIHEKTPRIIFVGGSSLSFGLNSELIQKKLKITPINTGVSAALGLQYMLNNTLKYLKEDDIVILAPEYSLLFLDYDYASKELLRTIFDVDRSKLSLLSWKQKLKLLPFIPKYTLSKLKPSEYFNFTEDQIYGVKSFNKYGDVDAHWNLAPWDFSPYGKIGVQVNKEVLQGMINFKEKAARRKASVYVTYPCFQDQSFNNSIAQIKLIENEYRNNGFNIVGKPEHYKFPHDLMFNTPYHLSKRGVDIRTQRFIEDFKITSNDKSINN